MGECVSNWLQGLVQLFRSSQDTDPHAHALTNNIQRLNLYGGDLNVVLDLMETSLRGARYTGDGLRGGLTGDTIYQFSQVASFLLEREALPVWRDLSPIQFESFRTRFLEILQELGLRLVDGPNTGYNIRTHNFGKYHFKET